MLKKPSLSEAAYRMEGQPMFKVLDKVKKLKQESEDIIHFEIRDLDFDTDHHLRGDDAKNSGVRRIPSEKQNR